MAEEEIDVLCFHLCQLTMDQVHSLEEDDVIPGLRLGDTQDREEVSDKVSGALESCESHYKRIYHLAAAYCWLFPRNQSLKWSLLALDKSMPPVEDFTLQMLIATSLALSGADLAYVPVSSGAERHACAITAEQQSEPEGAQIVVGMSAWEDLPYLAICFPGKGSVTRVQPLIEGIVKRKLDDMHVGYFTGLDEARAYASIFHVEPASDSGSVSIDLDFGSED